MKWREKLQTNLLFIRRGSGRNRTRTCDPRDVNTVLCYMSYETKYIPQILSISLYNQMSQENVTSVKAKKESRVKDFETEHAMVGDISIDQRTAAVQLFRSRVFQK